MGAAKARVNLTLDSLHRSRRGSVTGGIWFEFDDTPFPNKGWSDFVVVILGWWLESIRSNDRSYRLRFMDGPYAVLLSRRTPKIAEVACLRRVKDSDQELHRTEVDFVSLRASIVSAGRSVLEVCRKKGWESSEMVTLARGLEE